MVANPGNAPPNGPQSGNNDKGGEPIDMGTGLFVYSKTDLILQDLIPIALARTYRQNDPVSRSFGVGAGMPYDMFMVGDNNTFPEGYTFQDLILPDGGRIHFQRISPCTGANGYCDFAMRYMSTHRPPLTFTALSSSYRAAHPQVYGRSPRKTELSIVSRTLMPPTMLARPLLTACTTATEIRWSSPAMAITISPRSPLPMAAGSSSPMIPAIASPRRKTTLAARFHYSYDAGGRLTRVVDANGGMWNYTYDAFNQMTSIQDSRGIFYLTNQYDQNGRVIRQTQADNSDFLQLYH